MVIQQSGCTTAIYESPNRLVATLEAIKEAFGPRHMIYIGIELTKKHERHIRDSVERASDCIGRKA